MKICEVDQSADLQKIYTALWNDCSQFLNETGGNPLWRGFDSNPVVKSRSPVLVKSTLETRRPRDTHPAVHNIVDDWFLSRFGHRYRSDKILFAGMVYETANQYGQPAMVFPIGNYKYCWSQDAIDLTSDLFLAIKDVGLAPRPQNTYLTPVDQAKYKQVIYSLLDMQGYKTTGLGSVLNLHSMSEIMVHCDRYYIVIPEVLETPGMNPRARASNFIKGLKNAKP